MADKDNTLLILNNVRYRLALVLQNARSGPKIVVKNSELLDHEETNKVVTTEPVTSDTRDAADIVFFKHQGKFMALTGKNFIDAARLRENFKGEHHGRLISSVSLKNAKYIELPPPPAPTLQTHASPRYDSTFANRPRTVDERSSRYAHNGASRYPSSYRGNK